MLLSKCLPVSCQQERIDDYYFDERLRAEKYTGMVDCMRKITKEEGFYVL